MADVYTVKITNQAIEQLQEIVHYEAAMRVQVTAFICGRRDQVQQLQQMDMA